MTTYLIRRSIQSLLLLFVISMLIYVILTWSPAGPSICCARPTRASPSR